MKNVWFIGINSNYIHTNPAVRELASKADAEWIEFNINQQKDYVLKRIYELKPDVAAFSCYIWNIEYVLETAENLKKILPRVKILLGGPEVSYTPIDIMRKYPHIDGIICGEGEEVVSDAINALYGEKLPDGFIIRRDKDIEGSPNFNTVSYLNTLDIPFENYDYNPNKIFYYESSRGCPFSCAYCLSGDGVKLRYKTLERVLNDLNVIAARDVKLIKFIDRTFNADSERAYRIFNYIITNDKFKNCCFHFEIGLDLLTYDILNLLTDKRANRIQFEAGIQSCNQNTLYLVSRRTDIEKSLNNARYLAENTDVELHLDLIAGLPGENFESFKRSFNRSYEIGAHSIQLGFLKVLKGSRLREKADKYGIIYRSKPPYETLCTKEINAEELYLLKDMSELINKYYNTGRAKRGLDYLTRELKTDPFELYKGLARYSDISNTQNRPLCAPDQFRLLMDYVQNIVSEEFYNRFLKELKKDYVAVKIKGAMPKRLESI